MQRIEVIIPALSASFHSVKSKLQRGIKPVGQDTIRHPGSTVEDILANPPLRLAIDRVLITSQTTRAKCLFHGALTRL